MARGEVMLGEPGFELLDRRRLARDDRLVGGVLSGDLETRGHELSDGVRGCAYGKHRSGRKLLD